MYFAKFPTNKIKRKSQFMENERKFILAKRSGKLINQAKKRTEIGLYLHCFYDDSQQYFLHQFVQLGRRNNNDELGFSLFSLFF